MLAAAKVEHAGVRSRRVPRFGPLVAVPVRPPLAAPVQAQPKAPANPDYAPPEAHPAPLPPPPPLPPAVWDVSNAADLLAYIEQIDVEGLNPADYDPAGLTAAIA